MKQQERAWRRGEHIAGIWKRIKSSISSWDHRCLALAKKHNLPAWVGHMPVIAAMPLLLTGAVIAAIAAGFCVTFIWAINFIFHNIGRVPVSSNVIERSENCGSGPEVRAGSEGYGLYSGTDELTSYRMDKDSND
jgi:hypothetical protein